MWENNIFQAVMTGKVQYLENVWEWGVILPTLGRKKSINRSSLWSHNWDPITSARVHLTQPHTPNFSSLMYVLPLFASLSDIYVLCVNVQAAILGGPLRGQS